jgi:hypothetical protein
VEQQLHRALCVKKAVLRRSTLPNLVVCTKRGGVGFFGKVSTVMHRAVKGYLMWLCKVSGSDRNLSHHHLLLCWQNFHCVWSKQLLWISGFCSPSVSNAIQLVP